MPASIVPTDVFCALLLGAGIGTATAVFSITDNLLLKRLPVTEPQQLYRVVFIRPNLGPRGYLPYSYFEAIRRDSRSFASVFAWSGHNQVLEDAGVVDRVRSSAVSGNYFPTLGIRAALGRLLGPEDDNPAQPLAVVLSDAFWRRRYHADPGVVGRAVTISGHRYTIAGVLPPSFTDLAIEISPDVRVPLRSEIEMEQQEILGKLDSVQVDIGARLKPGFSRAQAYVECLRIYDGLKLDKVTIDLDSLERGTSALRQQFGAAALALFTGVSFLVVMVCANVAGLLLMRTLARSRELAVRLALGASRGQLIRLLAREGALVGVGGLILGLAFARVLLPLLPRAIPSIRLLDATNVPLALRFSFDARLVGFAALVALLASVGVTLAPALLAGRSDLPAALHGERSGEKAGPLRSVLVAVQVMFCTLLLSGALLFWQTYRALDRLDPGFDRAHVVDLTFDPSVISYSDEQAVALRQRILEHMRTLPGVEAAGFTSRGVMRGTGIKTTAAPLGEKVPRSDFLNSSLHVVSPEYFDAMGVRLLEGRNFLDRDNDPKLKPRPVIVNKAFVRRFFPKVAPLGRQFGTGADVIATGEYEIIGVVSDAKYRSLREPVPPTIYRSLREGSVETILAVRARGNPAALIESARAELRAIEPRLPVYDIHTLAEEVDTSLWRERLLAWLSLAFAAMAALLAATGLYGLVAYFVVQRTREIGIRMALGAAPFQIVHWLTRRMLVLSAGGAALGLLVARSAIARVQPLLYGVSSLPLWPAAVVAAGVISLALAAAVIPSRRAVKVDPSTLLTEPSR